MVCVSSKSLQNKQNCITGKGSDGQLVTSDGASGLEYSTSLLRATPAVLAAVLTQNYSVPNNVATQLLPTNVALDVATTAYAASIFNVFGQNISGQPIWVLVTYSITWVGANQGTRQLWLQTSYSNERYGYVSDAGTNSGNIQCGSCVLYLPQGASAAFWGFQSTNGDLSLVGGNSTVLNRSRWQTVLLQ
jgi:hypothetical protein